MEPFNIRIEREGQEVTLTILPTDEGYYKVIYYGGILGAIRKEAQTNQWTHVPDDEVIAGELPLYHHVDEDDRLEIVLNGAMAEEIGREIDEERRVG
ncbi:hypothetical protein [Pedobacter sp.]|uniref:hypothetical protein n=1 Tax=Pedobacter sp. TaxID=1411316 RepID=UPI003D7F2168